MPFIPHTDVDIKEMLATIGASNIEELYDEIPDTLRMGALKNIPHQMNEMSAGRLLRDRASNNKIPHCFIGAGAYEHHIPAAVWDVTSRGEFMTAYTPYQAEASQGVLQTIYEFQTMMANLTGMEVSNASLYDGASALAEAVLMAVRAHRKSKSKCILMPKTVHPNYRKVVQSHVNKQNIIIKELPYITDEGVIDLNVLDQYNNKDITAIVIPEPNFFGTLEEVDFLTTWAHEHNALVIAVVNPMSLGLLKEPGQWGEQGADIVCGEGQPFGVPLASGGPYFGFMCCKKQLIRQMPGRIVARTVDLKGREGYTLTLQAREQHIRRSKATSNICTNQGLLVTAATIYLSITGPEGLKRIASTSHKNLQHLISQFKTIDGVEHVFEKPFFHETVFRFEQPITTLLKNLAQSNILGGYDLSLDYPELGQCLLVCTTETKTTSDLDFYAQHLEQIVKKTKRELHVNF